MFEAEPARKKARKSVSFIRGDVEGLVSRGHISTDDEEEAEPRGSLLPRKLMAEMEEVSFKGVGLNAESIEDEDNEIWVLQCPASMVLSDILKGNKIRLDGETQIGNDGGCEKFEVIGLPSGESSSSLITLLPGEGRKGKLVGAPVKGHLIVREKIEELPIPKLQPEPKPIHTIPEGIKERHPIYGTDFESVFKAIGSRSKQHKKKRKSRKLEESFVEVPQIVEPEVRRKKKSRIDSEIMLNGHDGLNMSNTHEEETFKASSKRKSKVLNGLVHPIINAEDLEVSEHKKKKKKKSKDHTEDPNGSTFMNGRTNGHAYGAHESHYNGKIKSDKHLENSASKPKRSKSSKRES